MKLSPEMEASAEECANQCKSAVDNLLLRENVSEPHREMIRSGIAHIADQVMNVLTVSAELTDTRTARIGAKAIVAWMNMAIDGMLANVPEDETSNEKPKASSSDA